MKARGLAGHKIVFETLDDETNPVNAINAFRRVAGDPSVMLIYALTNSNSAMAIKSIASEFKVPIVSSGAVEASRRSLPTPGCSRSRPARAT